MTYCLAINVNDGLVLCSDSRTNAGADNVSVYSKMHSFSWPGVRFFALLSAGNLATTQAVLKKLNGDIPGGLAPNLSTVATMQEAADYVGMISAQVQKLHASRDTAATNFEASFILAGQIVGQAPEIFMIYPQGNYIHESQEHPFLQIGEFKYGKPILDRVIKREVGLERAARCALVSMNSTICSNVTVGPPGRTADLQARCLRRRSPPVLPRRRSLRAPAFGKVERGPVDGSGKPAALRLGKLGATPDSGAPSP